MNKISINSTIRYLLLFLTSVLTTSIALPAKWAVGSELLPPPLTLTNATWAQLVIPGDPAGLTVGDLFGAGLDMESYGESWIVYTFDAETQEYVDPGVSGSLIQGQGFWITQITGIDVDISLPESLTAATTVQTTSCLEENGCAEMRVSGKPADIAWHMWGMPFSKFVSVNDIRIVSEASGSPCFDGCTFTESTSTELVNQNLWHYDAGSESYMDLNAVGELGPWQGVWAATFPSPEDDTAIIKVPVPPNNKFDYQVSPFIDDPNILTVRNTQNGERITMDGTRGPEGLAEDFSHLRYEGSTIAGEVRVIGPNTFSFKADDRSELILEMDNEGNPVGASYLPLGESEPIVVGQLTQTLGRSSVFQRRNALSTASLEQTGRRVDVAVTKCGGVPQEDPRYLSANVYLSGGLEGLRYQSAGEDQWQKAGNIYSTYIPDYDNSWESTIVNRAEQALLSFVVNERNGLLCPIVNLNPVNEALQNYVQAPACFVLGELLGDAVGGISGALLPAEAACNAGLRSYFSMCEKINEITSTDPEKPLIVAVNEAIDKVFEEENLTLTLEVNVAPAGTDAYKKGDEYFNTESIPDTAPFGKTPLELSVHGGPVDTVATISTSPNPSEPEEDVLVNIEVAEKDGTGCIINKGTVDLAEISATGSAILLKDQSFTSFFAVSRQYNEQQLGDVIFSGYYAIEANDEDFTGSYAVPHVHRVATPSDVIRVDKSFVSFNQRRLDLEDEVLEYDGGFYGNKYRYITGITDGSFTPNNPSRPEDGGICDLTGHYLYEMRTIGQHNAGDSQTRPTEVSRSFTVSADCSGFFPIDPTSYTWTLKAYSPSWYAVFGSGAEIEFDTPDYVCASEPSYVADGFDCYPTGTQPPGGVWPPPGYTP